MKQTAKWLSLLLVMLLLVGCVAAMLVSCGGTEEPDPNPDNPTPKPNDEEDEEDNKRKKYLFSGMTEDGISWGITKKNVLELYVEGGDTEHMDDYSSTDRPDWAPYAKYINSLEIGEGVDRIGAYAFTDLKWLWFAEVGDEVEEIHESAFEGCISLMSVYLGSSLESIDQNAFRYCYRLAEVANDSDLRIKAGNSDHGMVGYYAMTVHSDVPEYSEDDDGFIYVENKGKYYLVGYIGEEESVTLPESKDGDDYIIAPYAFAGNTVIKELNLGGAKEIMSYAFAGDQALVSVTVTNKTKTIHPYAFADTKHLQEVKITGVSTVSNNAFEGATALVKATVSGTDISDGMFRNCTNLHTVSISGAKVIGKAAFYGCEKLESATLPTTLTTIGEYAFYGAGLRAVVLPEGVTTIGDDAFRGCHNLNTVTLPSSLKTIGDHAFFDATALIEVINKSSIEVVTDSGLNGYVGFYAKTIHSGDSKIGAEKGFYYITLPEGTYLLGYSGTSANISLPATVDGKAYYIYDRAFYGREIDTLTFPTTGVMGIGYQAFAYTKIRDAVTIPGTVTRVGTEAFLSSTVKRVTFGAGVKVIGQGAFKYCYSLGIAEQKKGYDSITTIEADAFYGSGLVTFRMPTTLTKIGNRAFKLCYTLLEVIDNGNNLGISVGKTANGYIAYYAKKVENVGATSKIVEEDGYLFYKGAVAYLVGYIGSESDLIIPKKATGITTYEIAPYAFYNRSDITSVAITGNSTVGSFAFAGCDNLQAVFLSKYLKKIKAFAFDNSNPALCIIAEARKAESGWENNWNCAESTPAVLPDGSDTGTAVDIERQTNKIYIVNYDIDYDIYLALMGLEG